MNFEAEERERRRLWGPADHKISWTEMCKRLSDANPSWAKEIGGGTPLFMSEQIHKLKLGRVEGNFASIVIQGKLLSGIGLSVI